ncbi:MAG: hypothetical protein IJB47_08055 [Oscillospiraceae bacterium]|nr:hypothetical protein [Oscillospiraceae bacterium]MBQ4642543.1 hypothetical protein [Oscillospiraceae bacterium]
MELFLKACGGILIGVMLWICLDKQGKEVSLLLTTAVSCMVMIAVTTYLRPVLDFLQRLQSVGDLDREFVDIILKAVGVGILSELCALICKDAGNAAIGKTVEILSTVVILWLSLPIFEKLLSLIDTILGNI